MKISGFVYAKYLSMPPVQTSYSFTKTEHFFFPNQKQYLFPVSTEEHFVVFPFSEIQALCSYCINDMCLMFDIRLFY